MKSLEKGPAECLAIILALYQSKFKPTERATALHFTILNKDEDGDVDIPTQPVG